MTLLFLYTAAAMGAAPLQTPATTQAARPPIPQAVRSLEIVEADGAYSIRTALPGVMIGAADRKAPALPIRIGNAVRIDARLFGMQNEVNHASDH